MIPDLNETINNIFTNKTADAEKAYKKTICELEAEKKFLLFIAEDIENGYSFGTRNGNQIVYKIKKILKQLKIEDRHLLLESNCVSVLRGLGLQAEKDYLNDSLIINI